MYTIKKNYFSTNWKSIEFFLQTLLSSFIPTLLNTLQRLLVPMTQALRPLASNPMFHFPFTSTTKPISNNLHIRMAETRTSLLSPPFFARRSRLRFVASKPEAAGCPDQLSFAGASTQHQIFLRGARVASRINNCTVNESCTRNMKNFILF